MEERRYTRPSCGKGLIEAYASATTGTEAHQVGPDAFASCRAAAVPCLLTLCQPCFPVSQAWMPHMANALHLLRVQTRPHAPSLLPLGLHLSAHRARSWAGDRRITEHLGLEGTSGDYQGRVSYSRLHIHVEFESLQRKRFHDFPGMPIPVLCHPQCKVVPHLEVELPEF